MANLRHRQGRMIEYQDSEGKWKSTHTKNQKEALKFLELHGISAKMTMSDFADDMFVKKGKGSYYELRMSTNPPAEFWWNNCKLKYFRYIRPAFGSIPLNEIDTPMVQKWYLNMDKYSTKPLSSSSMKKNLDVLSTIMEYAIFMGHIRSNPVKNVFKKPERCEPHEIFHDWELAQLFPEDREALERIWGNLRWACYFMVLRDTGFRPGEVAGLSLSGYIPAQRGVYTKQSVDSFTGKIKNSVKTTYSNGYDYRLGQLSCTTISYTCLMIAETNISGDDLLFRNDRGGVITTATSNKKLKEACERAGIRFRSCYSFRTTFFTEKANKMNESALLELMGHKKWRTCYDARTPEERLERVNSLSNNHV